MADIHFSSCIHIGGYSGKKFPSDTPEMFGLGDHIESALKGMGITKETWAELVGEYGKRCGSCGGRQKWLNWLGGKIGLNEGVGPELTEMIEEITFKDQPVYHCSKHGLCIGRSRFKEGVAKVIKASGIQSCQACPNFEEKGKDNG